MFSKIINLRLNLIIAFFLGFSLFSIGQTNCHIIGTETTLIDGSDLYEPGDTLCLTSGERDYFLFRNIHGTAEEPIVIINKGGQVEIITPHFYGIKFDNCSYIKLSGAGSAHQYGIYISYVAAGTGISIDNLSTDVEIENLEISNIPIAGIYAKTEPKCDLTSVRENFTMYNIKIHDCYLHDIVDEGFYIGSSKYTGQTVEECGTLLPHVIEGVEIYNNIIENTGWDGIQVSSAVSKCYIYGNTIRNDSYRETQNQMSGILIGGGSNCNCFNNKIFDGKGDGIDILGLGNHKIYNNLIVRPGKSYHPFDAPTNFQKHGIYVGNVSTEVNAKLYIYNNTIVSPKTFGIKMANTEISSYKLENNLIVDPGAYAVVAENSFLNYPNGVNFQVENNLFKQLVSDIQFQNTTANNFDLKAISPAVNAGKNLLLYGLSTDIDNRPRPYGPAYDIGAYECQESINGITDLQAEKQNTFFKVIPNPVRANAFIKYDLPKSTIVKIYVMDEMGRAIKMLTNEYQQQNSYQIEINKEMFGTGFFYLIFECDFGRFSKKLIII